MSPSAIIHVPAIASLVAMRPSIFVFPVCDLTPRIRYFLRVWGAMNGFRWRNAARTFLTAVMRSRPARRFSCSNAAVASPRFSVPVVVRATAPGGYKTTTICLCRICLRAVSPFSAPRGVRLPDLRLTARLSPSPRHPER